MTTTQYRRREDVPLVENASQAAENIRTLNEWLTIHSRSFNSSLRSVKRWYAIRDERTGRWLLGFSKFIGYRGMTGERYRLYRSSPKGIREPLSGRITENKAKPLWNDSAPIEAGTPLHNEILPYLLDFLRSQGLEKLHKNSSIRTLNGFETRL